MSQRVPGYPFSGPSVLLLVKTVEAASPEKVMFFWIHFSRPCPSLQFLILPFFILLWLSDC